MSKPFKKKSLWKELWEYVKMILFVVIVVLVVDNFLLINAVIPSESMENTIMTGDRIFEIGRASCRERVSSPV